MLNLDNSRVNYSNYGDHRARARIVNLYDKYWDDRKLAHQQAFDRGVRLRGIPKYAYTRDAHWMAQFATPSQFVLVDRVPKTGRDNFYKLWDMAKAGVIGEYEETEYGFVVPYRGSKKLKEYIFVVRGGEYKARAKADPNREMVRIYRMSHAELQNEIKLITERHPHNVKSGHLDPDLDKAILQVMGSRMRNVVYRARECFVDRLTKSEREKFAILKLAPVGKYIEGIGGVGEMYYNNTRAYVIIGDPK